ncbi:hypothetical protein [Thermobispora bispora]|jgi:hypothetical protein|uniref:Secreted protein n=1 Tax=Thermobispora bispora (strain ATCC 19993 / DSM 43833 / CBS 139.67 / JCM 10125 / KCTC 9307 / NBRC 14880 / R51) TaxID=469371 RepID=D6Y5N6_THEBD|nr:hypothetical protein [Thermobispora bispora]ADG87382.1 hypothetical protein Tbis_0657 [Thermobispora bispora DSM 43833]MBO2472723.1 hypothetical protein [Actinomycetales bacterium]MDI9579824.1 hypothetical protein [Thermobispora sp.]QSI47326.1 hypothetical protein CYL17_05230 [Thermobispora bispora]
MPKVIGRLGLILSTAFLMTGIAAAPASAGTAVTAKKPRCAYVSHKVGRVTQTVRVTNYCRYTISFSVKRRGPDSPCYILRPRHYKWYQWARGLDFQGIRWHCA